MKKYTLLLASGFFLHMAIAQTTDNSSLTIEFDKELSALFKENETGATALVSKNGEVIYKKAFGMANLELDIPMQTEHVFRIGSITKQFTAIAILQLEEKGKLSLQDEITTFIADYPTQGNKITVEHLLTHTSGIQSYTSMKDFEEKMAIDKTPTELIEYFKNEPMKFETGTQFSYNNSGYFLLGHIIEAITGQSYGDYVEENFFRPLGMTNSFYGSNNKIIKNRVGTYSMGQQGFENAEPISMTLPYAAGSIQSTVEDLFKWHQAVHAFKLVSKESLQKAFSKYTLADGTKSDYGYGWGFGYIQGHPTIEHGGGINGAKTMAIYLPDQDVFVTVFSNCDCISTKDVTARLAALVIGKPYQATEIEINNSLLEEYVGVFESEKGEQRIITLSDNHLYSQRGHNPKFIIRPFEKDKFFFEDALLTIEFGRNKEGIIDKLITHSRENNETWNKTEKPIASQAEIKVDEKILASYVGEYEIEPTFTFVVTQEQDKLLVKATGQDQFEIFPESESKFFLKVNDAKLEFVRDDSGKVIKVILNQGGRQTDAKKIK